MTILCIGDQHIQTNNLSNIDRFISKLKELIESKRPDHVVFLGDLLHHHEKVNTHCLNKAYELIEMVRLLCDDVYILVGNHDMINQVQFLTDKHWLNGMKEWEGLTVVDQTMVRILDNKKITFIPFVEPGRFVEALNTVEGWEDSSLIFAHQEFRGCKMGAITSVTGDAWSSEYPCVISGHIHDYQRVGDNIFYPGSALQHSFADVRKKILVIVDVTRHPVGSNNSYECEEFNLDLPKKIQIQSDIDDIDNISFDDETNLEDSVKLSVSGNVNDFKAFQKTSKFKELKKKGVKIAFIT
jgi:DNA repair exonuclease SbcCD nuclease subunit